MVKAYSQEHTYKHPWERVTSASWRKFADPENKRTLSHILEVDTLNHKLDPQTGKLYTTRAITIHAPGPWIVHKIVGQDICHCVESMVVDTQSRSMQLTTQNISLQKFIEVEEKIRYDPHPDNPNGGHYTSRRLVYRSSRYQHWHQWQRRSSNDVLRSSSRIVLKVERLWRGCVSV